MSSSPLSCTEILDDAQICRGHLTIMREMRLYKVCGVSPESIEANPLKALIGEKNNLFLFVTIRYIAACSLDYYHLIQIVKGFKTLEPETPGFESPF